LTLAKPGQGTRVSKLEMPVVTFQYDALGRRVIKVDESVEPNVVTRSVYDGQNVVEEYRVGGPTPTRLRYFVNGPTYIDERVILHDVGSGKDYVYLLKDLYTVAGLAGGVLRLRRVWVRPHALLRHPAVGGGPGWGWGCR